jgi:hypothetical protein
VDVSLGKSDNAQLAGKLLIKKSLIWNKASRGRHCTPYPPDACDAIKIETNIF